MKASDWIDRIKSEKQIPSDYAASKALGLGRAAVSKYRCQGLTFDEDTAIKVAELLGERPEVVLLDQILERSKNDAARSALGRVLKGLGGTMCGVVMTVGLWGGSPAPAEAGQAVIEDVPPVYIMSNHVTTNQHRLVGLRGQHSSCICAGSGQPAHCPRWALLPSGCSFRALRDQRLAQWLSGARPVLTPCLHSRFGAISTSCWLDCQSCARRSWKKFAETKRRSVTKRWGRLSLRRLLLPE